MFSELENTLSDIMEMELRTLPPEMELPAEMEAVDAVSDDTPPRNEDEDTAADESPEEPEHASDEPRLTFHTQTRLAAFGAFEEVLRASESDLQHLNDIIVRTNAAHHATRKFLGTMHASIHRANELEQSNSSLLTKSRKLEQQLEQALKLRNQHETLLESHKRRESMLLQEAEELKSALEDARQEASDSTIAISTMETERAELLSELAVKSSSAERHARENEILREKQANLSHEIEHIQQRYTEIERKFEELSAVHKSETIEIADLQTKIARTEKENYRVQKLLDAAQSKLSETENALAAAESELKDIEKRQTEELHTLKTLNEAMQARLDATGKAQIRTTNELGEVKLKLADAISERKALEDRLSMLSRDYDSEKQALSASISQSSQLAVQQQSDSILLEVHVQEAEELRREVGSLKATIAKLNGEKRKSTGRPKGRRVKGAAKRVDARAATTSSAAKKSA